jgi:hypothetical protein
MLRLDRPLHEVVDGLAETGGVLVAEATVVDGLGETGGVLAAEATVAVDVWPPHVLSHAAAKIAITNGARTFTAVPDSVT